MSWFPFSKSTYVKHAVIFDIASGSVGVSLITHNHKRSTSPQVLYTSRTPIKFTEDSSGLDALVGALASALIISLDDIVLALAKIPKVSKSFDVHIIAHSPWATSTSKTQTITFNKPTKFAKKIMNKILSTQFPELDRNQNLEQNSNVISTHITDVKLNGYSVQKAIGNTSEDIELTIMINSMHEAIKGLITDNISHTLHTRNLYFDTFVHVSSILVQNRNGRLTYMDAMLVDIGGEYIELTVLRNGATVAKTSLNFGSNQLLQTISEKTGASLSIAKSKFVMFNKNTCTPTECRNIRNALNEVESIWVKNFGDACSKLSKESDIPESVFISSDVFAYDWFAKNIEKIDFAQFTFTTKPFKATPILDENFISKYYISSRTRKDRRLLLDSLFVDKYRPEDVYEKLFML